MINKHSQKSVILIFLFLVVFYFVGIVDKNFYFENISVLSTPFFDNKPKNFSQNRVTYVIDGDTIEIDTGERVRLIGINAPEISYNEKPSDCFSQEAKQKLSMLVDSKMIQLERDVTNEDKYERLLRYVWIDNLLVNETLVLEGYAVVDVFQPDTAYVQRLYRAQHFARIKKKGLWKKCRT